MANKILTLIGKKPPIPNGGLNWDFVANNAVNYVETNSVIAPQNQSWMELTSSSDLIVQGGQSFIVKSLGLIMPVNFTLFDRNLFFSFVLMKTDGAYMWMDVLNYICIPSENYESEINMFVDMRSYLNVAGYRLMLYAHSPFKVSMIGVPTALNGSSFSIRPYAKVEIQ